jgi:hypothetical protein
VIKFVPLNAEGKPILEKYGVDNPKKSKSILELEQKSIKEKWWEHYMKNKIVQDKFNETMIDKWGVEWGSTKF